MQNRAEKFKQKEKKEEISFLKQNKSRLSIVIIFECDLNRSIQGMSFSTGSTERNCYWESFQIDAVSFQHVSSLQILFSSSPPFPSPLIFGDGMVEEVVCVSIQSWIISPSGWRRFFQDSQLLSPRAWWDSWMVSCFQILADSREVFKCRFLIGWCSPRTVSDCKNSQVQWWHLFIAILAICRFCEIAQDPRSNYFGDSSRLRRHWQRCTERIPVSQRS